MSLLLCMNPCLDLKSSYINFIKWMERFSSVFLLYSNVYINNSGAICVLKTGQNSSAKNQESVLLSLVIYFNLFGFSIFCINCKNFLFWFDFLGFFSFFMAMLHGLWYLISPTRAWTWAPAVKNQGQTTGLPGNPLDNYIFCWNIQFPR